MTKIDQLLHQIGLAREGGDAKVWGNAAGALVRHLNRTEDLTPAEAALCMQALDAEREALRELFERLERVVNQRPPRTAWAWALVVTPEGSGLLVKLRVSVYAGRGLQVPHVELGPEATKACERAINVGLGMHTGSRLVLWDLDVGAEVDAQIEGASLGLALAVATRAAEGGLHIPEDLAFTGAVDLDGRVGSVRGLRAKLEAASGRVRGVVLPRGRLPVEPASLGLEVVAIDTVHELVATLAPASRTSTPSPATSPSRPWRMLMGAALGLSLLGAALRVASPWPQPSSAPKTVSSAGEQPPPGVTETIHVSLESERPGPLAVGERFTLEVRSSAEGSVQLYVEGDDGYRLRFGADAPTRFVSLGVVLEETEPHERVALLWTSGEPPPALRALPDPSHAEGQLAWGRALGYSPQVFVDSEPLRSTPAQRSWTLPERTPAALIVLELSTD